MRKPNFFVKPLLGVIAALFLFGAAPAYAADAAHCDLTAIEASNKGKGIDSRLRGIKELTTPPLSTTYSRFDFLGGASLDLELGKEQDAVLTKTRTAKLKYEGVDPSGKLKFRIDLPKIINADISMKDGAYFFTATSSGFILVVKCEKKTPS